MDDTCDLAGTQVSRSAKAIEVRNAMMLTELYYYYGNNPAAKAASRLAFRFSPTTEKAACTMAVISASDRRRNRETAPECELSLDRQSPDQRRSTLFCHHPYRGCGAICR